MRLQAEREIDAAPSEGFLTVTEYEPDRLFAATTAFGPFRLHQRVTCAPGAHGGTRLTLTIDTRARGSLRPFFPSCGDVFS